MGMTTVTGRLPPETIQWIVRRNFGRFRGCYEEGLRTNPTLAGRVTVRFIIDRAGAVGSVSIESSDLPSQSVAQCVARAFSELSFPQPEGGIVNVIYPLVLSPANMPGSSPASPEAASPSPAPTSQFSALNRPRIQLPTPRPEELDTPVEPSPYEGRFKTVMDAIAAGSFKSALAAALAWNSESPGDVLSLIALGEALEATGDRGAAARAYGSIIDLFPARADLRRFAGARLERIRGGSGLDLALDTYEKAAADRPDHPSGHRMLAFALLKKGAHEEAFEAALAGLSRRYPEGRFAGARRILMEDLGLIAAAWIKAEPARRAEVMDSLAKQGVMIENDPSLRFVLTWETDANDVDFHIYDADGGHAFFSHPALRSGGSLYADVTTGYGPECFTVRLPKEERSKAYTLQAHYYARGPMGYGIGKVQVIDHDGSGGLAFEERPFVAMVDRAYVNLGRIER